MSRPYSQGDAANNRDAQSITKILGRVIADPKRDAADKEELKELLSSAAVLLLKGKRDALLVKPVAAPTKKRAKKTVRKSPS